MQSAQDQLSEQRALVSSLTLSLQNKDTIIEGLEANCAAERLHVARLDAILGEHLTQLETCQEALRVAEAEVQSKDAQHTEAVSEMRTKVEQLREESAELQTRATEQEAMSQSMIATVKATQDKLSAKEDVVAHAERRIGSLSRETSEALACVGGLRRSLATLKDTMDTLQRPVAQSNDIVIDSGAPFEDAMRRLKELLAEDAVGQASASYQPVLAGADNGLKLVEAIQSLQEEIRHAFRPVLGLATRLSESENAIASAMLAQATASQSVHALAAQLEQSKACVSSLESSLDDAMSRLTNDLEAERDRLLSAEAQLEDTRYSQRTLQSAFDAKEVELAAFAGELAKAHQREVTVQSAMRVLEEAKSRMAEHYEARIVGLQASAEAAESQANTMLIEMKTIETTLRDRELALEENSNALTEASAALAMEQQRMLVLERDLQKAVSRAANAEQYCQELITSKMHDEAQIRSLKEVFAEFSAMQRASLGEFDRQVSYNHCTTCRDLNYSAPLDIFNSAIVRTRASLHQC